MGRKRKLIELPNYDETLVMLIQEHYKLGCSVKEITRLLKGVTYSGVWFYAVNGGQPARVQETCPCGAKSYGAALCNRCRHAKRRARVLMAAKGTA